MRFLTLLAAVGVAYASPEAGAHSRQQVYPGYSGYGDYEYYVNGDGFPEYENQEPFYPYTDGGDSGSGNDEEYEEPSAGGNGNNYDDYYPEYEYPEYEYPEYEYPEYEYPEYEYPENEKPTVVYEDGEYTYRYFEDDVAEGAGNDNDNDSVAGYAEARATCDALAAGLATPCLLDEEDAFCKDFDKFSSMDGFPGEDDEEVDFAGSCFQAVADFAVACTAAAPAGVDVELLLSSSLTTSPALDVVVGRANDCFAYAYDDYYYGVGNGGGYNGDAYVYGYGTFDPAELDEETSDAIEACATKYVELNVGTACSADKAGFCDAVLSETDGGNNDCFAKLDEWAGACEDVDPYLAEFVFADLLAPIANGVESCLLAEASQELGAAFDDSEAFADDEPIVFASEPVRNFQGTKRNHTQLINKSMSILGVDLHISLALYRFTPGANSGRVMIRDTKTGETTTYFDEPVFRATADSAARIAGPVVAHKLNDAVTVDCGGNFGTFRGQRDGVYVLPPVNFAADLLFSFEDFGAIQFTAEEFPKLTDGNSVVVAKVFDASVCSDDSCEYYSAGDTTLNYYVAGGDVQCALNFAPAASASHALVKESDGSPLGPSKVLEEYKVACDEESMTQIQKRFATAVGRLADVKGWDDLVMRLLEIEIVFGNESLAACTDLIEFLVAFGEKTVTEVTSECWQYDENDPCCNAELLDRQCCSPREQVVTTIGVRAINAEAIADTCNEDGQRIAFELKAALETIGVGGDSSGECGNEPDFESEFDMAETTMHSCYQRVLGNENGNAQSCSSDEQCVGDLKCSGGQCERVTDAAKQARLVIECYIDSLHGEETALRRVAGVSSSASRSDLIDALVAASSVETCQARDPENQWIAEYNGVNQLTFKKADASCSETWEDAAVAAFPNAPTTEAAVSQMWEVVVEKDQSGVELTANEDLFLTAYFEEDQCEYEEAIDTNGCRELGVCNWAQFIDDRDVCENGDDLDGRGDKWCRGTDGYDTWAESESECEQASCSLDVFSGSDDYLYDQLYSYWEEFEDAYYADYYDWYSEDQYAGGIDYFDNQDDDDDDFFGDDDLDYVYAYGSGDVFASSYKGIDVDGKTADDADFDICTFFDSAESTVAAWDDYFGQSGGSNDDYDDYWGFYGGDDGDGGGMYYPYCGDGYVDCAYEECDGTSDCTADCLISDDAEPSAYDYCNLDYKYYDVYYDDEYKYQYVSGNATANVTVGAGGGSGNGTGGSVGSPSFNATATNSTRVRGLFIPTPVVLDAVGRKTVTPRRFSVRERVLPARKVAVGRKASRPAAPSEPLYQRAPHMSPKGAPRSHTQALRRRRMLNRVRHSQQDAARVLKPRLRHSPTRRREIMQLKYRQFKQAKATGRLEQFRERRHKRAMRRHADGVRRRGGYFYYDLLTCSDGFDDAQVCSDRFYCPHLCDGDFCASVDECNAVEGKCTDDAIPEAGFCIREHNQAYGYCLPAENEYEVYGLGCVKATAQSEAACNALDSRDGFQWMTRATSETECVNRGHICRETNEYGWEFYTHKTPSTCADCGGESETVFEWIPAAKAETGETLSAEWVDKAWNDNAFTVRTGVSYDKLSDILFESLAQQFGLRSSNYAYCSYSQLLRVIKSLSCACGSGSEDNADCVSTGSTILARGLTEEGKDTSLTSRGVSVTIEGENSVDGEVLLGVGSVSATMAQKVTVDITSTDASSSARKLAAAGRTKRTSAAKRAAVLAILLGHGKSATGAPGIRHRAVTAARRRAMLKNALRVVALRRMHKNLRAAGVSTPTRHAPTKRLRAKVPASGSASSAARLRIQETCSDLESIVNDDGTVIGQTAGTPGAFAAGKGVSGTLCLPAKLSNLRPATYDTRDFAYTDTLEPAEVSISFKASDESTWCAKIDAGREVVPVYRMSNFQGSSSPCDPGNRKPHKAASSVGGFDATDPAVQDASGSIAEDDERLGQEGLDKINRIGSGTIAGIIIGTLCAVTLLLVIVNVCRQRSKLKKREEEKAASAAAQPATTNVVQPTAAAPATDESDAEASHRVGQSPA